jgi:sulfonate transport system permease protein
MSTQLPAAARAPSSLVEPVPEPVSELLAPAHAGENSQASRRPDLTILRGLVLPITVLVVWYIATQYKLVNTFLLVRPDKVVTSAIQQYREGAIIAPLVASLTRDLLGFTFGTLVGLLVGGVMGMSRIADRLLGPSFHAAKQVALFAWIPLLSVWCGTGELAKVVFISLAAFYPVVLNTHEGVRSVAREYLEVAHVYRFTRWQIIRKVIVPGALPSVFAGVQLALIYAWLGTLGAEYLLAAAPGIGNLMIEGRESFAMDKVLVGVILAGAVGATLNMLAGKLEHRALRWRARGI